MIHLSVWDVRVAEFQAKKVRDLEEGYRRQLETLRAEFDTERYVAISAPLRRAAVDVSSMVMKIVLYLKAL